MNLYVILNVWLERLLIRGDISYPRQRIAEMRQSWRRELKVPARPVGLPRNG